MTAESIAYRRLPGMGASAVEYHRLYEGPDHLLLVASSGFSESYRRFYFRDIQDFTLRKTARGKVWNGIWATLAVLAGSIAMQMDEAAFIIWWIVAAVFLALLILNVVLGPTCICQIRTAVQTRPLAPLKRLRSAQKVIARLRPQIESVQAPMSLQELQGQIELARQGLSSERSTPPVSEPLMTAPQAAPSAEATASLPPESQANPSA